VRRNQGIVRLTIICCVLFTSLFLEKTYKRSGTKMKEKRKQERDFGSYSFIKGFLWHKRLVFWNSIHLEVASDSFCFLINSSWLLVFILYVFSLFFSGFNLYWWKGIHFS